MATLYFQSLFSLVYFVERFVCGNYYACVRTELCTCFVSAHGVSYGGMAEQALKCVAEHGGYQAYNKKMLVIVGGNLKKYNTGIWNH